MASPDSYLPKKPGSISYQLTRPTSIPNPSTSSTLIFSIVVFGLPDDYFTSYRKKILSVSTQAVKQAAEKYLHPEELSVVVVGSPEIVEPQLRDLNMGNISAITHET